MFRIFLSFIFLIFSLFLLGEAFYRWDGFRYYLSLSDFLPSAALAYVIWSILGIFTAVVLWLIISLFKWLCNLIGLRIGADHLLSCMGIFIIISLTSWTGKKLILAHVFASLHLKMTVIISAFIISVLLTWLFRDRTQKWIMSIKEHLTPLVWFFGLLLSFSLLLVSYNIGFNETDEKNPSVVRNEDPSAKSKGMPDDRPNIILVTFDALSPFHMSAYGYDRPTTPFIKKWAEKAYIFSGLEAASSYTGAATASLMTGKRVWTHRRFSHEKANKPYKADTENLGLLLKEAGYYNIAFTQNDVTHIEWLGMSNGFDIFPDHKNFRKLATIEGIIEEHLYKLFGDKFVIYNWFAQDNFILSTYLRKIPQNVRVTEYPPELIFNGFLETIDAAPPEPFFAWIHLLPPHIPILPPEPYAGTFNPSMEMREANIQQLLRTDELRKHLYKAPPPDEFKRKLRLLEDYYDEFLLYCDKEFEIFIKELEKRDKLKNTIVMLSSDHGESFDPDYPFHALQYLYERVTRIPLIIKEPDQTERKVIDATVEQIDMPATILELADIPVPQWMEGRSLVPFMKGEGLKPRPAFSMALQKNPSHPHRVKITKGTIAVWEGDHKLIYDLETGEILLFDLKKDPGELNNLFNKEDVIGQRLLSLIKNNLKEANKKIMVKMP